MKHQQDHLKTTSRIQTTRCGTKNPPTTKDSSRQNANTWTKTSKHTQPIQFQLTVLTPLFGQRPRKGRSPVEHRGNLSIRLYLRLSIRRYVHPPSPHPQGFVHFGAYSEPIQSFFFIFSLSPNLSRTSLAIAENKQ